MAGFEMNNFLYAMIESFEKMQVETHRVLEESKYTEKEKNELFFAVGTCLHSILDYADRVRINKEDKKLISAFRYANNCLKHCIEVKDKTRQQGGLTFPIHFPLVVPKKEVVWSIVNDKNAKYESQRDNYEKLLRGKDVIKTCKSAIEILEKYEL